MIEIKDKKDCCGCTACVQACPKNCISVNEDEEGFLYPKADTNICIGCGLCEKVCPVIHQLDSRKPIEVFACYNQDEEIRKNSSSGGVFTTLAEQVIEEHGVVFGASWNDNWEVVHQYTDNKDGLKAFRGSKYVQSRIGSAYAEAETFLKTGRKVLFSGTPCQIAALKLFLRKEYDNLITVDFICHGTPSPGVFRWYLQEQFSKQKITSIPKDLVVPDDISIRRLSFRDKRLGWKKFSMSFDYASKRGNGSEIVCHYSEPLNKDPFLRGFLSDLYLRPSCHRCPAKELKSGADFTIGDFWGIGKHDQKLDDDKGISALLINNTKYQHIVGNMQKWRVPYVFLCKQNPAVHRSSPIPGKRSLFWVESEKGFAERIAIICKPTISDKLKQFVKQLIRKT